MAINYDNIKYKITLKNGTDDAYSKITMEKAVGHYTEKIDNIVCALRKEFMENDYACTSITSFYILSKYLGSFDTSTWLSSSENRKKISDILSKKNVLLSSIENNTDLDIEKWG